VAFGGNVLLSDSIKCPCGLVMHRNGSGIVTLRGGARYQVTFNGNIGIPTGGTAAAIAVALAIDGESLQTSRAIVTPAAVEQYFNVTSVAIVTVPCGCCYTIAVENVDAGVGGEIVDQQTISVADCNLTVAKIS
jgi:hypothetical protein